MSKPTMQTIADQLGVSRITVWKALSDRPGVSDALRERIAGKAQALGYAQTGEAVKPTRERTVAVVVSRPESSSFWMQIIHHIAKELALHDISLLYTYMPSAYKPGYALPASLGYESVVGAIVLNIYSEELLRMLAANPLPKVFLDTVPALPFADLRGDLVLIEGRDLIRQMTKRLLDSGRGRVGFIGDVGYAQTNTDRYQGFLDAHELCGRKAERMYCMTEHIGLRSHYAEISDFLSGLQTLPDAFVCASDFIAHFVKRYLAESGREVPTGFVLTGFDNNAEYANVADQITTVDVQTALLGKRLAREVMFRADYPSASYQAAYVESEIIYREGV
ncbi:MAG: LacI family DNA-binding transcriptional regulator [Clostridia bacterium]